MIQEFLNNFIISHIEELVTSGILSFLFVKMGFGKEWETYQQISLIVFTFIFLTSLFIFLLSAVLWETVMVLIIIWLLIYLKTSRGGE